MQGVICINGLFLPSSEASPIFADQGLLYGFGLFETVLVREGKPLLINAHLERLAAGCATLNLLLPCPPEEISRLARETVRRNGLRDCALRLTLTAGRSPGEAPGTLLISTRPLPYRPEDYQKGFTAGWAPFPRNERSPLVKLKTLNYLENLLARREAGKKGWNEAIFLNTAGFVAEGTISNVFAVREGKVITPPADQGLLPGIMRRTVLEACRRAGLDAEERPLLPQELEGAEECFLTNSLMTVMPLVKINGRPVGKGQPGPITLRIREAVLRELAASCGAPEGA